MKNFAVSITEEQYAYLNIMAARNGVSISRATRDCLDAYFTENEPEYVRTKKVREEAAKVRMTELLAVHFKPDPTEA